MHIKSIPKIDRPREKLVKYGAEKLSAAELLALILRSGRKGQSAIKLAKSILKNIPPSKITNAKVKDLLPHSGIGIAKACEIVASFELGKRFLKKKETKLITSPREIWKEMRDLREKKKEYCVIFYLDIQNQIIKREIISIGTLDTSVVHPREVFETAITQHAAQIIISHNHPSGEITPSKEDIQITKRLIEAGKILGIEVIDHVIVTENDYLSLNNR